MGQVHMESRGLVGRDTVGIGADIDVVASVVGTGALVDVEELLELVERRAKSECVRLEGTAFMRPFVLASSESLNVAFGFGVRGSGRT